MRFLGDTQEKEEQEEKEIKCEERIRGCFWTTGATLEIYQEYGRKIRLAQRGDNDGQVHLCLRLGL